MVGEKIPKIIMLSEIVPVICEIWVSFQISGYARVVSQELI